MPSGYETMQSGSRLSTCPNSSTSNYKDEFCICGNLFSPNLFQTLYKITLKVSTCGLVFGHYFLPTKKDTHFSLELTLWGQLKH